jgi:hypothetical protein
LIVAARAAAGWDGWSEVDKLLAKEPWIDGQFGGEARELLTRSALARDADTLALRHASAAARDARLGNRQRYAGKYPGARRGIALCTGNTELKPITNASQCIAGAAVARRGAVEQVVPLERTGEEHESDGTSRVAARIACCRGGVAESQRVRVTRERRSCQQLSRFTAELSVDPRLLCEQLVDLTPAIPAGRGACRDDQCARRSLFWFAQHGRKELCRSPGMSLIDQALRVFELVALRDRPSEIGV